MIRNDIFKNRKEAKDEEIEELLIMPIIISLVIMAGRDSVVRIVTRYEPDGPGIESR